MDLKPESRATAIGSLPHQDAGAALDTILEHLTDIPIWPQLPARAFVESMGAQYSEGLPGIRVDESAHTVTADTGPDLPAHIERFYELYLAEDTAPFAISDAYAQGLHAYIERLRGRNDLYAAKGQITGPVTWGLSVAGADGRASFYNDMLRDGIVKGLARKAQWQARALKDVNEHVIIFIDEPYMQSIGSAATAVSETDAAAALNEVIEGIHAAGAYAGIHCCGNTNWELLLRTSLDILNFDAYAYAETLALYPRQMGDFLEKGGAAAWGIVPSSPEVEQHDTDSLVAALRRAVGLLTSKGIREELIYERALITPSCGAGTLTIPQSETMLRLTAAVSRALRGGS